MPTAEQVEQELNRVKDQKRFSRAVRNTIYGLITVAAIAVLVAVLLLPVLRIYGTSMTPTLAEGDIVLFSDEDVVYDKGYEKRILEAFEQHPEADFLLFNLGWDKRWGTEEYFGDYPCLDDEALEYIMAGDYKGIGFDVIGLDPVYDTELKRHNRLFKEKDIFNIENLKDLDKLGDELINFSCFPLKLKDCDGSPVRAVAWK